MLVCGSNVPPDAFEARQPLYHVAALTVCNRANISLKSHLHGTSASYRKHRRRGFYLHGALQLLMRPFLFILPGEGESGSAGTDALLGAAYTFLFPFEKVSQRRFNGIVYFPFTSSRLTPL